MLKTLQKKIEVSYDKSRKAKIGGCVTAIGGSVVSVAGFFLAPVTLGASLGLSVGGGIIALAGVTTVAGADIGYTAVSTKKWRKINKECEKDTELIILLQESSEKFNHLAEILRERYGTSVESMFDLLCCDNPSRVVDGVVHAMRIAKTATSTTRTILTGTRTAWSGLRPAIRVFGVATVVVDLIFIPIDALVLIKSAYDVYKYNKKGKSNSNAAERVQMLIDDLSKQVEAAKEWFTKDDDGDHPGTYGDFEGTFL